MKKIKLSKKRIKRQASIKFLIIIPLIISILSIATKVYAGVQDSNLVRNQIDGIYAVAPLSDKTHLYNLEIYQVNGKVTYCIEIGKKVTTTTYDSTKSTIDQELITGLSQTKLRYIKVISYFGYGYRNHTDYKYYMAAQELIWEYLNNIDITWTSELDINGQKINIESYKEQILSLVKKYEESPSLISNVNCKVGDTINLTDTKNILQLYEIKSTGNQQANINNNILTINISNNYIGQDKIVLKRENYYDYTPTLYYFDSSQALLSSGNVGEHEKYINLNIEGETLTTNLVDQDTNNNIPSGQATLAGAVYEIYDDNNNLVATFTTDETGENTIPNLYHTKYYIKQIKNSKGYKLNEEVKEINLNSNNNKLTLTERVIKSTVEIDKRYELGDSYQREPNIQFDIYDNSNILYTSIITTKYGPDTVVLPYGNYKIKQVNTTYGYNKVSDQRVVIDENSNTYLKYYLVDQKILSKLHITTKDDTTKNNIKEKDIKYKIKDKETNKYIAYIDSNNNEIIEFSTNEKGELTIPVSLPYGEYIIEQVTPPTKYLTNTKKINIIINDKSQDSFIDNKIVINVDFFNTPIIGKLNIITNKEIIIKNETLEKGLEKRENIEVELYKDNNLINTYKTNENGNLEIDNLSLGNYCIKEKDSNNKKCVTLINKDNKTKVIEKTLELTEVLKTSNVILNNIDTLKKPISGATIELYKDNDLIKTNTTNELGNIKITLPEGKYCFKQTKISSKYILNKEEICFEVDSSKKNINLTLINNLNQTQKIKIPDTLSNKKTYILPLMIILLSLGVVAYNKKNNKNINN